MHRAVWSPHSPAVSTTVAADADDGEEDSRVRAASRQLISGEEREATAAEQTVAGDLSGEAWCGGAARRRRRGDFGVARRERGGGGFGRFCENVIAFFVIYI